jgi:hypothetical protein
MNFIIIQMKQNKVLAETSCQGAKVSLFITDWQRNEVYFIYRSCKGALRGFYSHYTNVSVSSWVDILDDGCWPLHG